MIGNVACMVVGILPRVLVTRRCACTARSRVPLCPELDLSSRHPVPRSHARRQSARGPYGNLEDQTSPIRAQGPDPFSLHRKLRQGKGLRVLQGEVEVVSMLAAGPSEAETPHSNPIQEEIKEVLDPFRVRVDLGGIQWETLGRF